MAFSAQAQTIPDAGSIRQQIEQQRAVPLPQAVSPQPAKAPVELRHDSGLRIKVQKFHFEGNTLLSNEQLSATLADFIDHELDFAALQRAADAVAAAYREAGWIVRVYLPRQDASTGNITLHVVEARFAGVRFEGIESQRVMRAEIEAYFIANQAQRQLLNGKALDRALLLADDLPGVSVAGTLSPGQNDGETTLVVQTADEPLIYGDISLDNTGARATGSNRVLANLNVNSPDLRGDLFSLNLLHTEGSDYGRVALTVPVKHNGMRVGISVSSMTYKVIDGPSANTISLIRGRSDSKGVDWNYPLLRSRMANVFVSGGLENKTFFTEDTQVRSDYASNSMRLGLSGNQFDSWGGNGANSGSLQMLWGQLTDMQTHSLLNTIDRSYHKLSYSLSRQQAVTAEHSLLLSLQGQLATQVLDSSEKFYIGGANSVRAYPASELGGERGNVFSAEWRWLVSRAWVLSAFHDVGRVMSLPAFNSDHKVTWLLRGHGLSATWQAPFGMTTKLTWSHRNANNPHPTQTGADSDGTLRLNRFWLTASMPF